MNQQMSSEPLPDLGRDPDPADFALRAIRFLFLLLAVALPFVWFRNQVDPASLPRIWVLQLVLIPSMAYWAYQQGWRALPPKMGSALLGFLAIAGLSFIWSRDSLAALAMYGRLLTMVQVFLMATLLGSNARFRLHCMRAALFGGTLIALLGLVQTYQHEVPPFIQIFPPSATFINKNVAAQYLMGVAPIAVVLMMTSKGTRMGYLFAAACGVLLFYHIMASSRTAWLAALSGALLMAGYVGFNRFLRRATRSLTLKPILLRIVVCFLVAWALVPGRDHRGVGSRLAMEEEVASLFQMGHLGEGKINTLMVRVAMYVNSLLILADHPVGGVGLDNFHAYYPLYHNALMPTPTYSMTTQPAKLHNDPLQLALELGLVGLVAILFFFYLFGKQVHHLLSRNHPDEAPPWDRLGFLASWVTLLIMSGGSFPLHMPVSSFWFWFAMGLSIAGDYERDRANTRHTITSFGLCGVNLFLAYTGFRAIVAGTLLFTSCVYYANKQMSLALAYAHHSYQTYPADLRAQDQLLTLATNYHPDRLTALALADSFLTRAPYHPNGLYRKALILRDLKQYAAALDTLAKAELYGSSNEESLFLRGSLLLALKDEAAAKEAFRKALEVNSQFEPAIQALEGLQ